MCHVLYVIFYVKICKNFFYKHINQLIILAKSCKNSPKIVEKSCKNSPKIVEKSCKKHLVVLEKSCNFVIPMEITELASLYSLHPKIDEVSNVKGHLLVRGLTGSARSLLLAGIGNQASKHQSSLADATNIKHQSILYVADDAEQAAYLHHDLEVMLGGEKVLLFPSAFRKHKRTRTADSANEIQRTETLNRLTIVDEVDSVNEVDKPHQLNKPNIPNKPNQPNKLNEPFIVITSPEAIMEQVVAVDDLRDKTLTLARGLTVSPDEILNKLFEWGFQRVDFVYEPGQVSLRGGILDIFSYAHEMPYRIDFFGDEIDSIRIFDIHTQLSQQKLESVKIIPDLQQSELNTQHSTLNAQHSLLEYLPQNTLIVADDFNLALSQIDQMADLYGDDYIESDTFRKAFEQHDTIEFAHKSSFSDYVQTDFHTLPQTNFHKNFDLLGENLKQSIAEGYNIYILSDSVKQTDRLKSIFEEKGMSIPFVAVNHTLHEGFIDTDAHICCYTDHQIFERFHKVEQHTDKVREGRVVMTLKELNQLHIGDFIVHLDYGIGKFGGLVKTSLGTGKMQEMVKLIYKDDDLVFVNLHALHRISKYKSREGEAPAISKLGSGQWERMKERTKTKVKDIARDLIKLYAARKAEHGFQFSPDTYLQKELEASFIYEDTPDQQKATLDTKRDMESDTPMDRLICGDVGFGKTEIAMRAAFKAATDGKQVAVLVPTTVLALQHYHSFSQRLKDFPVTVEYLSRAKSPTQVKDILERLENGKIDIIIGTHKLVGKNVKFKDLGLLIIDEEQKFGVATKEKLKQAKINVDTLTLTATPIPRTLQFSLMGARDLSVMTTPPPNRYPIFTEVITPDDEDVIKEAIENEMSRNGQVFVINNRIQNLNTIYNKIHRIVPQARLVIAHGQMPTEQMEEILMAFIDYEYDVLIATSIIENGVDIPNANTIIINSAHNFGLSDLHQMRGRVGRSNKKAYCYLVAPDSALLTSDARRRLKAVETFSDLGSGFSVAMQDLDIRGAGNMLGSEQSGFIADLGYEAYQRILNEAIQELKENEFAELYQEEIEREKRIDAYVTDCQLDSDLEIAFPEDYIENVSERIVLYRELDSLTTEDGILEYKKRLIDRFGPIPEQAEELIQVLRMRWKAMQLGIERVVLKNGKMIIYLVSNPDSIYYKSKEFGAVLQYAVNNPHRCQIREKGTQPSSVAAKNTQPSVKRSIVIDNVKTVNGAYNLLTRISELINQ